MNRSPKELTVGFAGIVAIVAGIGFTVTQALAPQQPTSSTTAAGATGTTAAAAAAPNPSPTPVTYGNTGLAAQYAKQLGHPSLSAACEAGIEWTCGVERIAPALGDDVALGETSTRRDVFTREPPMDGDQAAAEWLAASPASVTGINLRDTSQFSVTTIGTATRKATS